LESSFQSFVYKSYYQDKNVKENGAFVLQIMMNKNVMI